MSEEIRTKDPSLIHVGWGVLDKFGEYVLVPNKADAKREARLWNKQNGSRAPHRPVEIFVREIKS